MGQRGAFRFRRQAVWPDGLARNSRDRNAVGHIESKSGSRAAAGLSVGSHRDRRLSGKTIRLLRSSSSSAFDSCGDACARSRHAAGHSDMGMGVGWTGCFGYYRLVGYQKIAELCSSTAVPVISIPLTNSPAASIARSCTKNAGLCSCTRW